jgi:hypothetical protein
VSTKRTNRVASKKHTSGNNKKIFLSELTSRDLRGENAEKSDQNLKKNFSVLAGLRNKCFQKLFLLSTVGNMHPENASP